MMNTAQDFAIPGDDLEHRQRHMLVGRASNRSWAFRGVVKAFGARWPRTTSSGARRRRRIGLYVFAFIVIVVTVREAHSRFRCVLSGRKTFRVVGRSDLSYRSCEIEADSYLGKCDSHFDTLRYAYGINSSSRAGDGSHLRGLMGATLYPSKGFCDSFIAPKFSAVFTQDYLQTSRTLLSEVVNRLPSGSARSILLFVSDSTDGILDEEVDLAWTLGIPVLLHNALGSRNTSQYVFIPDSHFIRHRGYIEFFNLHLEQVDLRDRSPSVFWRGSSTSHPDECQLAVNHEDEKVADFNGSPCRSVLRTRMVLLARTIRNVNARLIKASHCCADSEQELRDAGVMGLWTPEPSWAKFRGVLDVDGVVNAWGLYWRLASGSVVFRVQSKYINSYSKDMLPWVHYIPVNSDLSDLGERSELVSGDNPATLHNLSTITQNAYNLVHRMTFDSEVSRVADELVEAWRSHEKRG